MIYYKQESYDIIRAAFEVYNKLGHGFLEAVYQECLEIEFKKRGIPYEREKNIKIFYDGIGLTQSYRADFVCYDKISQELKAVSALDDACSWFDFTKMIAEIAGNTACDIQPCHSDEFLSPVKRPAYSVLDKAKVKETFYIKISHWTESLKKCMTNLLICSK